MPTIEGTTRSKTAQGSYSFAAQGGAISTITLAGDNGVPAGAVVTGGFVEVTVVPTSGGAATIAVSLEGAGDLVAAAVISGAPWSTTGRKAIIPVGAATSVKTTVARAITISIAAFTLTAGTFRVVLFYV